MFLRSNLYGSFGLNMPLQYFGLIKLITVMMKKSLFKDDIIFQNLNH